MSYDIYLEVDLGGPEPVDLGIDWNYTSNCAQMWRAAGADLADFHGRDAVDCIAVLRAAITTMETDPAAFETMNPQNGWGSYATLLPALRDLLRAFQVAPQAKVRVWR